MSSFGPDDAGFRMWRISRSIDRARSQAREAASLVNSAHERHSPDIAAMQTLLLEIENATAGLQTTWEQAVALTQDQDPGLVDPPVEGVSVIRSHGSNPTLAEAINAIWAEEHGVTVVRELFEQLQRLAQDTPPA
jgi:hypothetical protein